MADLRQYLPTSVLRQLAEEGYRIVRQHDWAEDYPGKDLGWFHCRRCGCLRDEDTAELSCELVAGDYTPDLVAGIEGDEYMSQADNAVLADLKALIDALTGRIEAIEERLGGKDLSAELYGETPDHAADRAARAAFQPKPKPLRA